MITNVIQLESHDDVVSIKDKMTWQDCQRLILVWPKRGRILNDSVELFLLKRTAKSLGFDLAIVTHNPVLSEWAHQAKLPLFTSITTAESATWPGDNKSQPLKNYSGNLHEKLAARSDVFKAAQSKKITDSINSLAILLSVTAVAALLFVLLPGAQIVYYPITSNQEMEISINASEDIQRINPTGDIPAEVVFIETSGESSKVSSGKTSIPVSKASGKIELVNLSISQVVLPAGTILLTDTEEPTSFILKEEALVPEGVGNSVLTEVESLIAGLEGNVAAGTTFIITGGFNSSVSATNTQPFTGGDELQSSSPSEADYTFLESELMNELMAQALTIAESQIGDNAALIKSSLRVEEIVLEEKIPQIDQPANVATMRMKVRFGVLTYQKKNLEAIARLALDINLPNGMEPVDSTIEIQEAREVTIDSSRLASWTIRASRPIMPVWDEYNAASLLASKKVNEVDSILAGFFSQSKPAEVKVLFNGWPWMPFLATNIQFINGLVQ